MVLVVSSLGWIAVTKWWRNKELEEVLKNAEATPTAILLTGAYSAYGSGRLEDAAFLLYTARIRRKHDLDKYQPTEAGANDPNVYLSYLFNNISEPVNPQIFLRPVEYAAVVKRLDAWTMKDPSGYNPGWDFVLSDVPPDFPAKVKSEYMDFYKPLATLLSIPEYFQAFKVVREYNDLSLEKQSDPAAMKRRSEAMDIMRRIEKSKNLKGAADLSDVRDRLPSEHTIAANTA